MGGERQEQFMKVRAMTDTQRDDIVAIMAGAIPLDLTFEEARVLISAKPFVAEIHKAFAKRRLNAVPIKDERFFELVVDNDVDPMRLVASVGCDANGWEYLGPKLSGNPTLRVKLVRLGHVSNIQEARERVDAYGWRLVEGQARGSFMAKFPQPDGKGPVIFGGSGWRGPHGGARMACLYDAGVRWDPSFRLSCYAFHDDWRWLVADK